MEYILSPATISSDGRYRYTLHRLWDYSLPDCTFICLNPSIADHKQDDPSLRKMVGFAQCFGFGSLHVGNLFSFRATQPSRLHVATDPVGAENDEYLKLLAKSSKVICAWGADPFARKRASIVEKLLTGLGVSLWRLGPATKDGCPRHPLYTPYAAPLELHRAAELSPVSTL